MTPRTFSFPPPDLPPSVALALFEMLQALTEALWQHYEADLIELISDAHPPSCTAQQAFDFDDELTF